MKTEAWQPAVVPPAGCFVSVETGSTGARAGVLACPLEALSLHALADMSVSCALLVRLQEQRLTTVALEIALETALEIGCIGD